MINFENEKEIQEYEQSLTKCITADSYIVYDMDRKIILKEKNRNKVRQVASLTKIMNIYTCIQFLQQEKINLMEDIKNIKFYAGLNTKRGGTTAKLLPGMFITIYDLFYGLMLPSGNDAAYVLAENIGTIIIAEQNQENWRDIIFDKNQWKNKVVDCAFRGKPVEVFLNEMNNNAKILNMKDSFYANTNGLGNVKNVSSVYDVAILSTEAMKIPLIQKVVNQKFYEANIENDNELQSQLCWENTNKLLGYQGWYGIKTGITPAAGPCMSCCIKLKDNQGQDRNLVIVVAKCSSTERRWQECIYLSNIAFDQDEQIEQNQQQIQQNKENKGFGFFFITLIPVISYIAIKMKKYQ